MNKLRILIIDSHKGGLTPPQNLHWLNALRIKDHLTLNGHMVDFIWSYKSVNYTIKEDYDLVIFNHASQYSFVDYEWLRRSPRAKLFYITNEYNLGEPRILWMAVKEGRRYSVIANHSAKISKVVTKYTDSWNVVNINALIADNSSLAQDLSSKSGCIYYGSFRKGRIPSFVKYFNCEEIIVSTHKKNRQKFIDVGVSPQFIDRVNWKVGLKPYQSSLYIEDEVTHTNYNFPANRFYEAINDYVIPFFDDTCLNTLNLSVYKDIIMHDLFVVHNLEDLKYKINTIEPTLDSEYYQILEKCRSMAMSEKSSVLDSITNLIVTSV